MDSNKSNDFAETFEELRIWVDARTQAEEVYRSFGNDSAAARDFGFRDQIQRAAISVMNNIAEGFERRTPADFSRFLDTSKSSCGEVRSMLYLAEDLNYLAREHAQKMRTFAKNLSRSISALNKKVRTRI